MRDYDYKGFKPYGAAEMYCIDMYVDDSFSDNVTEEIIKNGVGTFEIINDNRANLVMKAYTLPFVKR